MQTEQRTVKFSSLHGLGLAFQFLTILPIHQSFVWNLQTARWSIMNYPIVGFVIGILASIQVSMLEQVMNISPLILTVYLFSFSIIITGGLHLDGWMDLSDAYFSRGTNEKKLEIMKDSRVGAFGVLSVLFLLGWRFAFMYEIINGSDEFVWVLFLFIPFLARTGMVYVLIKAPLVKKNGMAFAMKEAVAPQLTAILIGYLILALIVSYFAGALLLVAGLIVGGIMFALISCRFFIKNFGGITGDMLGACVEGTETWLWFAGWLLLCFVTV
ncbi:cobalamin 5'-phosphate synthase [Fictibacillus arsenicus]|uniref:Adenosylcobinamide-GDP ribazoletransferase n=1 Tax=Fictibacillus arsenicus TaxID=255247 RepID=A0A1B1Z7Z0_9BACL|nr:adenosylcobinamide-GDP ribazoletransferase [Fictibacillus arsenicus]ANX13550.1 cobalamin 5'-phosphate synthase [Fictibacillus arsenicus]